MKWTDLFDLLRRNDCIDENWGNVLKFVESHVFGHDVDSASDVDPTLCLLCVYFSLIDDGNVCMSMDKDALLEKWDEKMASVDGKELDGVDFPVLIGDGVEAVNALLSGASAAAVEFGKLFKLRGGFLFIAKYLKAVDAIAAGISRVFTRHDCSAGECKDIRDYFDRTIRKDKPFVLNDRQIESIARGVKGNLIINGGPGTGKTTVITFLLWKLLDAKNGGNNWHDIFFAAPSGKASARIRESVMDSLKLIPDENGNGVGEKLKKAQFSTIHKLLGVDAVHGGFKRNSGNRFEENSIIVIDEASMMDISLFAAFLEAVPDGCRVYIMGDDRQLPSVQAGAVLGDLLTFRSEFCIELVESMRFNANSEVGRLAFAIQNDEKDLKLERKPVRLSDMKSHFRDYSTDDKQYPVECIELSHGDKRAEVKEIVVKWAKEFWSSLSEMAACVDANDGNQLEEILEVADGARILCAERRGVLGCEGINRAVRGCLDNSAFFSNGNLVMVTDNIGTLGLNNGDTGVVATTAAGGRIVIFGKEKIVPLMDIPFESLELSYAMTIHKSQGSGYKNILVFLPDKEKHPLLNRQILYTAITRTKGRTFIVASERILGIAKNRLIKRDNGLFGNPAKS